jgi:hypothetical protein
MKRTTIQRGALAFALTGLLAGVLVGSASANLTGSTFEGNDGNLTVNTAGNTDWVNAPNRTNTPDAPSGTGDTAFGQGTSENDVNVTVKDGPIPNSKADLAGLTSNEQRTVRSSCTWPGPEQLGARRTFDFESIRRQPDLTTEGANTLVRTPVTY